MTDRELIELAAKAAGYHWVEHQNGLGIVAIGQPEKANMLFNPLESDADAFRLAVKVGFDLSLWSQRLTAKKGSVAYTEEDADSGIESRMAAARRAITRAAAEIGKAM